MATMPWKCIPLQCFFADCVGQLFDGDDLPKKGPVCWSLFGHIPNKGLESISDFLSFEAACEEAEKLGGVKSTEKIS
jgi:hypothetical protein